MARSSRVLLRHTIPERRETWCNGCSRKRRLTPPDDSRFLALLWSWLRHSCLRIFRQEYCCTAGLLFRCFSGMGLVEQQNPISTRRVACSAARLLSGATLCWFNKSVGADDEVDLLPTPTIIVYSLCLSGLAGMPKKGSPDLLLSRVYYKPPCCRCVLTNHEVKTEK